MTMRTRGPVKFRLTVEYDVLDEAYDLKDEEEILDTEYWLLGIKGVAHYLLGMADAGRMGEVRGTRVMLGLREDDAAKDGDDKGDGDAA